MNKLIHFIAILVSFSSFAQIDYSDQWEDLFSYNNVKFFEKEGDIIYAVVDNAVFIYNESTEEVRKFSSVQGLSGETTATIHYSNAHNSIYIGYDNGLMEVIDENNNIIIASNILDFNLVSNKEINDLYEYNDNLYIATSFGIVVYDMITNAFGDTYIIGQGSTTLEVNQTVVFQGEIYAATEQGVFKADVANSFLIDYNNWTSFSSGNYSNIGVFNDKIYTSKSNIIFEILTNNTLQQSLVGDSEIIDFRVASDAITITFLDKSTVYNSSFVEQYAIDNLADSNYEFNLNTSLYESGTIYLATNNFGILKTSLPFISGFEEIHPEGPVSNAIFSITADRGNLWVVYGGIQPYYAPLGNRFGFDYLNENGWNNIPFDNEYPMRDLVNVTIDPENANKAYISSFYRGVLVFEDGVIVDFYDETNSTLEVIGGTIRVYGTAFDKDNNLWVTNAYVDNKLHSKSPEGQWSAFNLSSIASFAGGMNDMVIDQTSNVWIGTRRGGTYVHNIETGQIRALNTDPGTGSVPDLNVRALAVDDNNRVWIGSQKGLVVYDNPGSLFDQSIYDAEPIIILDEGIPKKLLGELVVNSIIVDGANNKWFGLETSGVIYTNPNGQETLAQFDTSNSPLPSNNIKKIAVDVASGKVYFGTDKGIVAYDSNIAPYGDVLGEVYAYPNPVLKNHAFVTIDGRNGGNLPEGTNVKILDAAGRLVYETNVREGEEVNGGKVLWDKTNMAGNKVASGIYVVMLSANEGSETSITKIAIVN